MLKLSAEKEIKDKILIQEFKDDPTLAFAEVKLTVHGCDAVVFIRFRSNNLLDPDQARNQLTNPAYEMSVGFFQSSEPTTRAEREVYYGTLPDIDQLYMYCVDYLMSNYMRNEQNNPVRTTRSKTSSATSTPRSKRSNPTKRDA